MDEVFQIYREFRQKLKKQHVNAKTGILTKIDRYCVSTAAAAAFKDGLEIGFIASHGYDAQFADFSIWIILRSVIVTHQPTLTDILKTRLLLILSET